MMNLEELLPVAVVLNAGLLVVAALLHAGWQPRRQVVVLLIAAPLLLLAAMLATDELVTAAVATLATVGVAIFLEQRRLAHASGEQPW